MTLTSTSSAPICRVFSTSITLDDFGNNQLLCKAERHTHTHLRLVRCGSILFWNQASVIWCSRAQLKLTINILRGENKLCLCVNCRRSSVSSTNCVMQNVVFLIGGFVSIRKLCSWCMCAWSVFACCDGYKREKNENEECRSITFRGENDLCFLAFSWMDALKYGEPFHILFGMLLLLLSATLTWLTLCLPDAKPM